MRGEAVARDRRRFPRWRIRELLPGWIGCTLQVFVADISLGGVLIEHPNIVRPGSVCFLTLLLPEETVSLKCRVVRSDIYSQEAWPTGERNYVYRTGVEVLESSDAAQRRIGEYIASLKAAPRE
ncbi:MAG: PilZ domain-containing protein [Candidatus Methylomirabilales bacterium]